MTSLLLKFWVTRFAVIGAAATAVLGAVEFLREPQPDFLGVMLWGVITADIAASLTTYWMYRRSCLLPR